MIIKHLTVPCICCHTTSENDRNFWYHEVSETISHERLKLSCKIRPFKNSRWKSTVWRCEQYLINWQKYFHSAHSVCLSVFRLFVPFYTSLLLFMSHVAWNKPDLILIWPHNPRNDRLHASASSTSQETAFAHDHQHAIQLLACNFATYSPILNVFSLADSAINFKTYDYWKFHHISSV